MTYSRKKVRLLLICLVLQLYSLSQGQSQNQYFIKDSVYNNLVDSISQNPEFTLNESNVLLSSKNLLPLDLYFLNRLRTIANFQLGKTYDAHKSILESLLIIESNNLEDEYYLTVLNDQATLLSEISNTHTSIELYLQLINHFSFKNLPKEKQFTILDNLSNTLYEIGQLQLSLYYSEICAKRSLENQDTIQYIHSCLLLSRIHMDLNQIEKCSFFFREATEMYLLSHETNQDLYNSYVITQETLRPSIQGHGTSFGSINKRTHPYHYVILELEKLSNHIQSGSTDSSRLALRKVNSILNENGSFYYSKINNRLKLQEAHIHLLEDDTLKALQKLQLISDSPLPSKTDKEKIKTLLAIYNGRGDSTKVFKLLEKSLQNNYKHHLLNNLFNGLSAKNFQFLETFEKYIFSVSKSHRVKLFSLARRTYLEHKTLKIDSLRRQSEGDFLIKEFTRLSLDIDLINAQIMRSDNTSTSCKEDTELLNALVLKRINIENTLKNIGSNDSITEINAEACLSIMEGIKHYHLLFSEPSKPTTYSSIVKSTTDSLLSLLIDCQRNSAISGATYHLRSSLLYHQLFPNILDFRNISHLTIIPDGEFSKLAFETLPLPGSTQSNPIYLVDKVPISYSLGTQLSRSFNRTSNAKVVSFSPSFQRNQYTNSRSCATGIYSRLICNSEEAASSADHLDGIHYDSSEASVKNFLNAIPQNDVIHLASHACIDTVDYLNSKLILNDGDVRIRDLYDLDFNGKTVVLSACSTAEGRVMSGEGVLNLVRVLTELGCKDMIVSLWPIDDCETSKLLNTYFSKVASGVPPAVSLQQAKIEYLKNADKLRSQSFYWAPLIYFSNDINTPSYSVDYKGIKRRRALLLPLAVLGIIIISVFIAKRKRGQAAA